MRKILAVALFVTIVTAVSASGCSGLTGSTSPTPTVVYGPVPSPLSTPTPTPTPGPAIANSKPSDAVKAFFSSKDYEVVNDAKTRDGRQYETINLVVANDGTETADQVVLTITITDRRTANTLIYMDYPVGDMARGEMKSITVQTDAHDPTNIVKLNIRIHWGEFGEYYNPNTYPAAGYDTFTFPI
ncbi:MAG TPA: hypothetical protein VLT35_04460 [Methanocella sp.]|nr:hypothetical protein [Methanocella sp.]